MSVFTVPYLLAGTPQFHLAKQNSENLQSVAKNIYVDNLALSLNSTEEALGLYQEAKSCFDAIKMNLREWNTNSSDLKAAFQEKDKSKEENAKVFGLKWITGTDHLQVSKVDKFSDMEVGTKREVLHVIASVFDPLGLVAPVTVKGKFFLQGLWKRQLDWDTPLPRVLKASFDAILSDLKEIPNIQIPRYVQVNANSRCRILVFADASVKGYGAAVYLWVDNGDSIQVNLILAKSRVAPKKGDLSIPRLELMALHNAS